MSLSIHAAEPTLRIPRLFEFAEPADAGLPVLHDRIELRPMLGVQLPDGGAGFHLTGEWRRAGRNGRALVTKLPIADASGEVFCDASLTLDFRERQPGYFETGGSACLRLNGNRLLRALMEREGLGPSLDGNTNWVGDFAGIGPDAVLLHYDGIGRAIAAAREKIIASLPAGSVLLRADAMLIAVEACHDVSVADAAEVVAAACRVAATGARSTDEEVYSRGRFNAQGRVARYRLKGGATLTIYAKWGTGVRIEVSCRDRDSVAAMVGERVSCALDPDAVVLRLLDPWMDCATPIVRDGVAHIEELAASGGASIDLVDALDFMAAIERGQPIAGGYRPRDAVRAEVRRLRRELLEFGETSVKGYRSGTQVRRVMEMGVDLGVLRHEPGTSTYRLAARFALPGLRLSRTIENVECDVVAQGGNEGVSEEE